MDLSMELRKAAERREQQQYERGLRDGLDRQAERVTALEHELSTEKSLSAGLIKARDLLAATVRSLRVEIEQERKSAQHEVAELRAEVARLREALAEILDHVETQNCDVIGAIQRAQEALAQHTEPEPAE